MVDVQASANLKHDTQELWVAKEVLCQDCSQSQSRLIGALAALPHLNNWDSDCESDDNSGEEEAENLLKKEHALCTRCQATVNYVISHKNEQLVCGRQVYTLLCLTPFLSPSFSVALASLLRSH